LFNLNNVDHEVYEHIFLQVLTVNYPEKYKERSLAMIKAEGTKLFLPKSAIERVEHLREESMKLNMEEGKSSDL
jgi:hypothetical protein